MINKALFLKEMGISSWITKENHPIESNNLTNDTQIEKTKMSTSNHDLPIWTIIFDNELNISKLMKNVEAVVRSFGVHIQVLPFDSKDNKNLIQGQLLICMGEKSGAYFSGEINPVENLREIIFETSNAGDQDIPVIVTHALKHLVSLNQKIELWNDLIFARNVYLDTMS